MKIFRPFDIVLAVIFALAATFFFRENAKNGDSFLIFANGEVLEIALSADTLIVINSVEILVKNKEARVIKSSCRNQICTAMPALSSASGGTQTVCVPNRVIVSLSPAKPENKTKTQNPKTEIDVYVQ